MTSDILKIELDKDKRDLMTSSEGSTLFLGDLGGEEGEELWDSGKNASNQVATFQQPKLYPKKFLYVTLGTILSNSLNYSVTKKVEAQFIAAQEMEVGN
uniref:Uncharacterized protein n=1 Tax=Timema tahoe TaxID=61484 RepID=A0A7R9NVI3_9NEOP|nr:unnamed protein product [Timema tahoe]